MFNKYHAYSLNQYRQIITKSAQEKGHLCFQREKQNVNIRNQHCPNREELPAAVLFWAVYKQLQQRTHEYLQLLPEQGTVYHIFSSRSSFLKKLVSLSETAHFTFNGPQKEDWLWTNPPDLPPKHKSFILVLWLQMASLQSTSYKAITTLKDLLSFNLSQSNSSLTITFFLHYLYLFFFLYRQPKISLILLIRNR